MLTQGLRLVRVRPDPDDPAAQSVDSPLTVRCMSVEHPLLCRLIKSVIDMTEKSRTNQQRYEQKQREKLKSYDKTTVRLPSGDHNLKDGLTPEGRGIEFIPPSAPPKPEEIQPPKNWRPDRTSAWPDWLPREGDGSARVRCRYVVRVWSKAHLEAFSRAYEPVAADWELVHRWIAEDQHDATDLAECLAFAAGQMAGRGFAPRSMAPLQADVDAEFIEILEGSNGKRRFGRKYDGRPGPHVPDAERPPAWRKANEYLPNRGQVIELPTKKPKTDQERLTEAMRRMDEGTEDQAEG